MTASRLLDHSLLRMRNKTLRELSPRFVYSADYGLTLSGAKVTTWAPRIGTTSFTQSTDNLRPTYLRYGLGNERCLVFSGANMMLGAAAVLNASVASLLVVCEFMAFDNGLKQPIINVMNGTTTTRFWQLRSEVDSDYIGIETRNEAAVTSSSALGTALSTDPHVILVQSNAAGNGYEMWIDGVAQTLTAGDTGHVATGPGDITTPNQTRFGQATITGETTRYAEVKVALIAGWNQRI